MRHKPRDPESRLGIYKSLQDVPSRYRLETYADSYEGTDVWDEYIEWHKAENKRKNYSKARRAANRWKDHMSDRGRHHALAQPQDVESWANGLLTDLALRTSTEYWRWIFRFYRWMTWHTDYPHRYNPFKMAASDSTASRKIWEYEIHRRENP